MVASNGGKYRIVDRVARKWLAVPETSTPSDTAKWLNLLGVSIEKKVIPLQPN